MLLYQSCSMGRQRTATEEEYMPRKASDSKSVDNGRSAKAEAKAVARVKPQNGYNAKDLDAFRKLLFQKRESLLADVNQMRNETLRHGVGGSEADKSAMPTHMADLGTDTYEREFTVELLQNETAEIKAIDEALSRIKSGDFGTCKGCGKKIRKVRLKALPHASMCIQCQRTRELG